MHRSPMNDERLTIEAKIIYLYICSFALESNEVYIQIDQLMKDLGFKTIQSFQRHRILLSKCGYLDLKVNAVNTYIIL